MTNKCSIKNIHTEIEQELSSCGIEDASLEAAIMLEHFTGCDRLEQLRHPEREVNAQQLEEINKAVQERCRRKPLSQILGEVYFYGRPFYVTEDVLTPRPDTEILVEAVLQEIRERYLSSGNGIAVLDSCTGSGCIGLSLLLELKVDHIIKHLDLCDNSREALEIARRNAKRHAVMGKISLFDCDLWPNAAKRYDVITCNPPYINREDMEQLMPEVAQFEPYPALYGGSDGLEFYRRLAAETAEHSKPGAILAVEHAYDQRAAIKEIFADSPFAFVRELDDYGGNARVLIFELRELNPFG